LNRTLPTRIERVDVKVGYDLWAETYDTTANPVVAMDARDTMALLAPARGERILDAGCGTGRHLGALLEAGSEPIGIDFSSGMLSVARRRYPSVPFITGDVGERLPFETGYFDAILCALIGEHLTDLAVTFDELHRVLREGGRLVFSVYHPQMAAAGKEAHFQRNGTEIRLGAMRHTLDDYLSAMQRAGFQGISRRESLGDEQLGADVPAGASLLGFPVLLILLADKGRAEPAGSLA